MNSVAKKTALECAPGLFANISVSLNALFQILFSRVIQHLLNLNWF